MLYSIKGKVTSVDKRSIIIEANDIGYEILVSDENNYMKEEFIHLYLHHLDMGDFRFPYTYQIALFLLLLLTDFPILWHNRLYF